MPGNPGNVVVSSGQVDTVPQVVVVGGQTQYFNTPIDGATVLSGGILSVIGKGEVDNLTISSGGAARLSSGGLISGATVDGGVETVFAGGVASNTVLSRPGGTLIIHSGGLTTGTVVSAGEEFIFAGGEAIGTTVSEGGFQDVYGSASATILLGDPTGSEALTEQTVRAGGFVTGVMISGGLQSDFGTAYNTTVGGLTGANGAVGGEQLVHSGGLADGVSVSSGGNLLVLAGGSATDIAVENGGSVRLLGGDVSAIDVNSGGSIEVESGGLASDVAISDGGSGRIDSGGSATGVTVNVNVTEFVYAGGSASDVTLDGGQVSILGGAISGLTLDSGKLEYYGTVDGIDATNGTIEAYSPHGGETLSVSGTVGAAVTATVAPGAILALGGSFAGTVTLQAGSILKLDDPGQFTGSIADLVSQTTDPSGNPVYVANTIDLGSAIVTTTVSSGTTLSYDANGTPESLTLATPLPSDWGVGVGTATDGDTILTPQAPETFHLTAGRDTAIGLAGNDTFYASGGTLTAGDVIDGQGGSNDLILVGGGVFDLRAPTTLANIQTVEANEGQTASGSSSGTDETVYLRAGTSLDVVVLPAPQSANPNPAGIVIVGAANEDLIVLGGGIDTVVVGGPGETIEGGSGTDTYDVTAATIGATIAGGSGSNVLQISGGGTVTMGGNITGINKVVLQTPGTGQPAYDFTANGDKGLAIQDNGGPDTVTLGDASQSVTIANGGNAAVYATAANAGASVISKVGVTTLVVTTGGTVTLNPADFNIDVVLRAAADVTVGGGHVVLQGSSGNDIFEATAYEISNAIVGIDGGGGRDTLKLIGAGTFTLASLATFANIEALSLSEGQAGAGGMGAGTFQTVTLRAGTALTVTVASAAPSTGNSNPVGISIYGAANSDTIQLGNGTDNVVLGSSAETVDLGTGTDTIYATGATLGGAINAGGGTGVLWLSGGGTEIMSANEAVNRVVLAHSTGQPGSIFTANAVSGLEIDSRGGADIITVGAANQIVNTQTGSAAVTIKASAANAGVNIVNGAGPVTLEIVGGGTGTLNKADANLTVTLDQTTNLTLSTGRLTVQGSTAGGDMITAAGTGQTLIANGTGETFVGSLAGGDVFKETAADTTGETIANFGVGTDTIDLTDVAWHNGLRATVASDPKIANATDLSITDGTHTAAVLLLGQLVAGTFKTASDGHGGTNITYVPPSSGGLAGPHP